jgi:hypothetical protein
MGTKLSGGGSGGGTGVYSTYRPMKSAIAESVEAVPLRKVRPAPEL